MKTISLRRLATVLGSAFIALTTVAAPAYADPTIDQNVGIWADLYDDSNGIAPVAALIGGFAGQANVVRDPIGRSVSLATGQSSGYWFTSEIAPASFDAWKAAYLDYAATTVGNVQIEVWNVTNGNVGAVKLFGPVNPGISDDPAFGGKISLSGVSASATRLRLRVILTNGATPPSVSAAKVTFNPRSVLQVALEAPATRPSGETIQLRMPVSISFVNATQYVAYTTIIGTRDDRYTQVPQLTFESATLGGQWTAAGLTVQGVAVPARSVYWATANQQAGQTFAYYATFRSPNGLVRGIGFDFEGKVFASNASSVVSPSLTTRIEAAPRTTLLKNASGTFVIGGAHFARNTGADPAARTITMIVSPTNWWNQQIPAGAQTYFQPVVWDSFADFITKGAIDDASAITNSSGGKTGATAENRGGFLIPANSVYWVLANMPPGQRLDLSYRVVIKQGGAPGAVINECPPRPDEAWLATPQESVPPSNVNDCATVFGQDQCQKRSACLPIHIGLNETPGIAISKGDDINGSAAIIGGFDDNQGRFITWGQPANFKIAVGNSSLAHLEKVAVYDYVRPTWTLLSASIPASQGTVWYWRGTVNDNGVTPPHLYSTNLTVDQGATGWTTTRPATPTWVAFEIPALRSSYCSGPTSPNGITNCAGTEPTSVTMDFSVIPVPGNVCDGESPAVYVDNGKQDASEIGATVRVYRHLNLAGTQTDLPLANALSASDWERIQVKPLTPDLTTSFTGGQGSIVPGNTVQHTITVQNRSALNNPIDTARTVIATLDFPEVNANGIDQTLELQSIDTNGGLVTFGTGTATVTWPSILPNAGRTITLVYQVPTGVQNATNFRTTASVVAQDDCGIPTADVNYQTSVASAPSLSVEKDLDFRVVDPGTSVTYGLSYYNFGTAPSTKTWIIDRIADGTNVISARVPAGTKVYYSWHTAPFNASNPTSSGLPDALIPGFNFSDAVVQAHFKPGLAADMNGWSAPDNSLLTQPGVPLNARWRWVALPVDLAMVAGQPVSPWILPSGLPQTAEIKVGVPDIPASIGQLITNEAAIVSDELLQAIGNRVNFIVSEDPGIAVAKSCDEVVSVGEDVTYTIHLRNDTTNLNTSVVVRDTFPLDFEPVTFSPQPDSLVPVMVGNREQYTWTLPALASDLESTIVITGKFMAHATAWSNVKSGTIKRNEVIASATNGQGIELSFFDDCPTLIQNTDVSMTKLVNNPEPRSGEDVTYSLAVINHNLRDAAGVRVTDTLPTVAGVPNAVKFLATAGTTIEVLTPNWSIVNGMPAVGATSFDIQLKRADLAAGIIPGGLTPTTIRLRFRAHVEQAVGAGKTLINSTTVSTTTGQDCLLDANGVNIDPFLPCQGTPDTATVTAKTPLPDPQVSITATPLVAPGEIATWNISYANSKPEDAENTVVYFTLPDGPGIPQPSGPPLPNGTPNETDFTLSTISFPPGVQVFYSQNPINARPSFVLPTGGTGWLPWNPASPPVNNPADPINHLAFFVKHCGPTLQSPTCDQGDIFRLEGPFQITVKAEARRPDSSLPARGGAFEACTEIQMIGVLYADNDPTNNGANRTKCATVLTPGVGLGVEAICDPNGAFPGLPPGESTTFAFDFVNNGTVDDIDVSFIIDLDPRLEYLFDTAGVVELTDATGASVTPVGLDGARVGAAPNWIRGVTPQGDPTLSMGGPNFGLARGDRGRILVSARVRPDVDDGIVLSNKVTGNVEGTAADADEVYLGDNAPSCGNTVYRADVFVIKSLSNATDPTKTLADGGDKVHVTVEYGNVGHFSANNVVMTDQIVEGLELVPGSVRNVPFGASVQYAGPAGTWDYTPTGVTDPNVRGIRIVYDDNTTMPAPAGSVFTQTTINDFNDGDYNGTRPMDAYQAVGLGDGEDDGCRDVNSCNGGPYKTWQCETGSYLQEGNCCQSCCPNAEEIRTCQRTTGYDNEYKVYLACLAGPGPCTAPSNAACVPENCTAFCAQGSAEPSSCSGGNGYYQPDRQCNRQCCPGDGAAAFASWKWECLARWESANSQYTGCVTTPGKACGNAPRQDECDSVPNECQRGASPLGMYYSPEFPGADEGNVLDWGRLIVDASFGVDENHSESITVEVFTGADNNYTLASFDLEPNASSPYVFDLSQADLDPALYPNLRLRAELSQSDASEVCACPAGLDPNEAGTACVGTDTTAAIVSQTTYQACAAIPNDVYSYIGARFHATTTPGEVASDQAACSPASACVSENTEEWIGHLNTIGVWACGANQVAGSNPTQQWIGFSKCITIATSGDYLLGIAGDNHVLLRIDGVTFYQSTSNLNFRTWNVFKASLTAGTHIIELYGKNDGGPASFGAEVAGPFPPGSIATPTAMAAANYAGNIVFSTLSQRGQPFQTSLDASTPSGTTCPSGYGLNLCADTPSCTRFSETVCSEVILANGTCMGDIVPSDPNFWGFPTGLNESGLVIGFQDNNLSTIPQATDLTAFAWQENHTTVTDLHAVLPNFNVTAPLTNYGVWQQSVPTDVIAANSDQNETVVGWADLFPSQTARVTADCTGPTSTQLNLPTTPNYEPAIVWKNMSDTVGGSRRWQSACLPPPDATRTEKTFEPPKYPASALVYINDSGMIAGTYGAKHRFGGGTAGLGEGDPRYGTATIWCQSNEWDAGPLDYQAQPLRDYSTETLVPLSTVTGINNDSTVIGVGVYVPVQTPTLGDSTNFVAVSLTHHAYAWQPSNSNEGTSEMSNFGGSSFSCPYYWRQIDLTQVLATELSAQYDIEAVPLDIDNDGNIVGTYLDAQKIERAVLWVYDGEDYQAVLLQPEGAVRSGNPKTKSSKTIYTPGFTSKSTDILGLMFATTHVIGDGKFSLTSVLGVSDAPLGTAWHWNGVAFSNQASEILPNDAVTGSYGSDTTLGTALYVQPATGVASNKAWADFGDGAEELGWLVLRGTHMPVFSNASELVIGSAVHQIPPTYNPWENKARIFHWRECSHEGETPLLNDWTVLYQTDKNPRWEFDVTLSDICTETTIQNTAEISTSTPEISLENNRSQTSISVNTADLATAMELDAAVIAPNASLSGEASFTNTGPGTARNVAVELRLPNGCDPIGPAYVLNNPDGLQIVASSTDAVANAYSFTFASVPVGKGITANFTCDNGISTPGRQLAASIAVSSPTIDCIADNDAASTGVLVGYFPNLYVGIVGTVSTPVGVPAPYEVTFGNNGNEDGNGTIEVSLPPGSVFALNCTGAGCPPTGVAIDIFQPGPTTPGKVIFTANVQLPQQWPTFSPDENYTIPFTLTWPSCASGGNEASILANVLPAGIDANVADNAAAINTLITAPSGALALVVDRSDVTAEPGKELLYTFHFGNPGYQAALGTQLTINMPSGLRIDGVIPDNAFTASSATFNVGQGTTVKSLLPGSLGGVTVRATVTGSVGAPAAAGLATLSAAGSSACGVTAPIPAPTVLTANTGLHVLVSSSVGSACPSDDEPVTWTVTVTNPHPTQSVTAPIEVTLPPTLQYVLGSIGGIGASDVRAPILQWAATVPAQGTLAFTFETAVVADDNGIITIPAIVGAYSGAGTLAVNCEDRLTLTKTWDLSSSCGASDTFDVKLTLTNGTAGVVTGTLYDTFQVGSTPTTTPSQEMDARRGIRFPVTRLAPGASVDVAFTVSISNPLYYGDPIMDRAVFDSNTTIQTVSNQVAGAVSQCPAGTNCTGYTCEAEFGCVAGPIEHPSLELCGNSIDDNCNGQTDEGFPTLNTACNSTSGDDAGDDCLNDRIDCVEGAAACVTKVKATESCDGVDNDCNEGTDEGFTFTFGQQSPLALGASCDGDDNGTCANGTVVCNAGHTAATCLEVGVDLSTVACSAGLGECKQNGFFLCNGTCGATAGTLQVVNDLCGNSKDDNCNGVTDLDFPLFAQIDRPCDSTATDRNGGDADLCIGGAYICDTIDRTKVTCTDDNATIAELCNGIDDDCDGTINEGFTFEGITLGAACDGPDGDLCATGIVKCNAADNNSTICTDDTISTLELCNGIDDNCDGRDDENWTSIAQGGDVSVGRYLGLECDGTNDADFCERGTIECNITFTGVICLEEDLGVTEVCNGQDDTCDCNNPALVGQECVASIANGMIDEGFGVGSNCTTDELGLCKRPGITACAEDDNTTSFCEPLTPSPAHAETCNAIDDDCDGSTDEPRVTTGPPIVTTLTCLPLETDITTGPPAITASTTATFTYVNPVAVPVPSHTTFECSLDGGLWVTCNHVGTTPSLTYNNLPQGQHTLLVRATRGDGAVDPTPDFWTWIIDTTLPDTTILSGPTNPSQNPNGTFVFGSPTPNPAFYSCVLDPTGGICPPSGGAYAVCPEIYTFTNLGDGSHTMCVFVTNTAGTQDPLPASYTWIIDTTAPETEIVALIPPKVTSSTSIILHYIDPTAPTTNTFECSLDGDVWTDCDGKTITYTALTEGEHVFDVRTIDPNGVIDPTPATFTWIIDRTAPCPDIATKPTDPAQSDVAIFGFSASEANVTYFCALDPLAAQLGTNGEPLLTAYSACTATVTFDGLADGTHTLWVYVKDQVGNVGTCRASYTWLIDTRFPETEITDGPTPLIGTGEVSTLDYIDPTDEQLFTFECSLDGAVFTRCDGAGTIVGDGGTLDYDNLPVGKHSFLVRACDFTKAEPVQCDPTPAQWLWEVTVSPCPNDRDAPAIACAADLVLECRDGGATVDLAKLAPTSIDACLPVATTTSASADVALGQTPLVFTSQDPNGNISSCVTLVNVVDVTKPTITCPPDVAVATDVGVCTASFDLAVATGNDTCQGTAGLLFLSDAPDFFIPGTNIVTHHVLDSFGNEATCEQEVVVTDGEDLVLTCSESLTVEANPDACEWSGVQTATATDNCSDELTVDVDGTYPVGVSPILFTAADAAGNSAECTTELTVLDVTNPVAACGTAVGVLPTVIRATATDACKVTVTLENVVCNRVVAGTSTPFELADCPIAINGDAIEITGRLADGELTITYDARAVDASGNFAVVSCSEAYDPDKDGDGIVDAEDNCALTVNGDQTDVDDDGIGDLCDNCPATSNEDQADVDNDGVGNVCSDKDKDGVLDAADNCPADPNSDQSDVDDDTFGDACDEAPFEGLTAEGSGGCAGGGGAGGLLGGLLGLVGIFAAVRARRR